MAATYNPALATDLDKVRYAVGDTDVANAVIPNETIAALLGIEGATVASVAVAVSQAIWTQYQKRVTYDVDGEGERFSDLAKNYANTVAHLRAVWATEVAAGADEDAVAANVALGGGIIVGGTSVTKNIERASDPDRAANFSPRYR